MTSGQPHGRITYRRRPSPTTNVRGTFFFFFFFFFGGGGGGAGVLDFDVWSTAWQNHLQTTPTLAKTPSTGLRHPSTTAVFSYAIGSRKLSANEQFFVFFVFVCFWGGGWCSDSRFVTNNSNKTRRVIYSRQHGLHQHK